MVSPSLLVLLAAAVCGDPKKGKLVYKKAAAAEADDAEFTKVCLNLGRSHGHKAATIRALLRDQLGLEGRSIRDLTVRDGDTLFRVHAGEVGRIQEALTGVREGTVRSRVSRGLAALREDMGATGGEHDD